MDIDEFTYMFILFETNQMISLIRHILLQLQNEQQVILTEQDIKTIYTSIATSRTLFIQSNLSVLLGDELGSDNLIISPDEMYAFGLILKSMFDEGRTTYKYIIETMNDYNLNPREFNFDYELQSFNVNFVNELNQIQNSLATVPRVVLDKILSSPFNLENDLRMNFDLIGLYYGYVISPEVENQLRNVNIRMLAQRELGRSRTVNIETIYRIIKRILTYDYYNSTIVNLCEFYEVPVPPMQ